ncbi:MAG: hypothetical protein HWN67_15970 [Candidatus Helarchaeota archaeon]|nr:hypothetical protein [Candidatus Helarchaeota archaeon]
MDPQQITVLLLGLIIFIFAILLILITKNILQHRKIYSFRSDDRVWDHWGSQVYGLSLFIIGFVFFVFCFFAYVYLSNPAFFGIGFSLDIFIRNPFEQPIFLINTFIGFSIAIIGMIKSIISIREFIKNIESAKGG